MTSKGQRERFTFRIPNQMHDRLKEMAKKKSVSVNALILQILEEWAKSEGLIEK